MGKIERFEDIRAWQKARVLTQKIYNITGQGAFERDFSLKDQIRRAAISIMLNIAEGFARHSNQEFKRFLFIAHASAAEVQSALYIALDQNHIGQDEFKVLYQETDEVSRLLSGFIKYLNSKL